MIGSTWNKWDLHIHSPLTNLNSHYGEIQIPDFVEKLHSNDLVLVGITNYFYFADNELELIREEASSRGYGITMLGNVEFRLDQQNKDGEWINIHAIFAEHISTQEINSALSSLQIKNTGPHERAIYCSPTSLSENNTPISDVTVSLEKLLDHLKKHFTLGTDYLVAVCPNGYGGFRPDSGGRSLATAVEIEKRGQLILGRQEDRSFFLHELTRYEGAVPKPVFVCSDAHRVVGHKGGGPYGIGDRYTWVKAKATFEGLRQTLIEPESRVEQADDFVERTFVKPRFSAIELGGPIFSGQSIQFHKQKIQLNPNLVAIIGGRGTGKSLLLDSMVTFFQGAPLTPNVRSVKTDDLRIVVDQGDGTQLTFDSEDNSYSYLHVSQGDIQKFTNDPRALSSEIKRMLGIRDTEFDSIVSDELSENLALYREFVQFWEQKDEQGNSLNSPSFQENAISRNQKLLDTITSPQNKQLIQSYQSNLTAKNTHEALIRESEELKAYITRHIQEINRNVQSLNKKLDEPHNLTIIDAEPSIKKLQQNVEHFKASISQYEKANSNIVLEFKKQGINQDVSSLLDKVSIYQSAIDFAKKRLSEIKHKEEKYQEYVQKRGQLISQYEDFLNQQKGDIDSSFRKLQEPKPEWDDDQNELVKSMLSDIKIRGAIVFDEDKFYYGLEQCLNKGKFRSTVAQTSQDRLKEIFSVSSVDDFFSLVNNVPQIKCDGEDGKKENITIENFFWRSEYFNRGGRFELLQYLFSPENVKTYLYVNAEFEYKGKTVEKLSVGQRGTFYVCLKLATDPFGSPFVFDQPEDDLDNDFIMSQLVPLFKKIKKYRQVIIVTHNANLVVNTDAEQIIVAKNEDDIISYDSGALEDGNVADGEGTKSKICKILEGGSHAFEKRERKYGIQSRI